MLVTHTQTPPISPCLHTIESYSGYLSAEVALFEPENLGELRELVQWFYQESHSYSLMGAGVSIDGHFMHQTRTLSLRKFTSLSIDLENKTFTAGAGVIWGDIVKQTLSKGYLPHVVPTTTVATVGGTLSNNTYSRTANQLGREGDHILSFRLLTPNGDLLTCSREEHADLFYATIGGLGVVGIVYEVTHKIMYTGSDPGFMSFGLIKKGHGLLRWLQPRKEFPDSPQKGNWTGSGFLQYKRKGKLWTIALKHRFIDSPERDSTLFQATGSPIRVIGNLALQWQPKLAAWLYDFARRKYESRKVEYSYVVDDAYSAVFLMESNITTKKISKFFHLNTRLAQQDFHIPARIGDDAYSSASFQCFMEEVWKLTEELDVEPIMVGLLYLPKGDPFVLSANKESGGHTVSIVFEGTSLSEGTQVFAFFERLSRICYERFGGRIHLIKNAYVEDEVLAGMYGKDIATLSAVKKRVDPKGLLTNALFERLHAICEPPN